MTKEDKKNMFQISNSKLTTFRSCQYKYDLNYVRSIEPKLTSKPLWFGIWIHELLDCYYDKDKKDWKIAFAELLKEFNSFSPMQQIKLGENAPEEIKDIMLYYIKYWKEEDKYINYIELEKFIEVELFPGVRLTGKVDGIIEYDGNYYILEHKTYGSFKLDSFQRFVNQQTIIYCYVLEKFYGYKIKGVMWDFIKSEAPREPSLLKDGSMSKAKNQKIIPLSYIRGLKRNKLKKKNYLDVLDKLEPNNTEFFERVFLPVNRRAMKIVLRDVKETVDVIQSKRLRARNLSKDCKWCQYKSLCEIEFVGGDIDYLLRSQYKKHHKKKSSNKHKKSRK